MFILRVQHEVPNYEGWKRAFDSDPLDRKASGVRSYHVHRSVANPSLVTVVLEFNTLTEAEGMLEKLRELWAGPGGAVMQNPEGCVYEWVETKDV